MVQLSHRHAFHPWYLAAILYTAILTGCTSTDGLDAKSELSKLPAAWTTDATTSEVDTQWWLRFEDERLSTLINEAQRQNTGIGQAESRTRQARAQAQIAGADRLPQLSGAFNASRQEQPLPAGSNGGGTAITESYGASLNISWEIDLWGAHRRAIKSRTRNILPRPIRSGRSASRLQRKPRSPTSPSSRPVSRLIFPRRRSQRLRRPRARWATGPIRASFLLPTSSLRSPT